jgi:hypothetical protein
MRRGASGCREQHGFAGERVRRNKIEKMFQDARVGIFVDCVPTTSASAPSIA